MAYKITDECMGCTACMDACEFGAIKEADGVCVIDQDECQECGACVDECSFDAIVEE